MSESALTEWLRRLEGLHPSEIDLSLERVREVADRLSLLAPTSKTVVIAGTNGKGSVAALLQASLVALGVPCGCYTSPHLRFYNERISINGSPVDDADIVLAFEAIDGVRGDISLTYFEFGTLAALWIFREYAVQWQILEVGLGGRLDAVNILDADIAAITSIGLDHQEWLGPTREHIAVEKAAVARACRPCVVMERSCPSTLLPNLTNSGADIIRIGRDFDAVTYRFRTRTGAVLTLEPPPAILPDNVAGSVQILELMGFDLRDSRIADAISTLHLAGRRCRIPCGDVEVLLDVAHNRESVAALGDFLDRHPVKGHTRAVYASLSDKPTRDILSVMASRVSHWYFPAFPDHPRAVDPECLVPPDSSSGISRFASFSAAWRSSLAASAKGDRLLVFGSFVTVGEALSQPELELVERVSE